MQIVLTVDDESIRRLFASYGRDPTPPAGGGQPEPRADWLTIEQLAAEYPVSDKAIRAAIATGDLKAAQPGLAYIVKRTDFEAWLDAQAERETQGRQDSRPVRAFRRRAS